MLSNGSSPCLTNNGLLYIATMVTKINVSRIVRCSLPRAANGLSVKPKANLIIGAYMISYRIKGSQVTSGGSSFTAREQGCKEKTKVDVRMMVEVLLLLSLVRLLTRLCSFAQSRRWTVVRTVLACFYSAPADRGMVSPRVEDNVGC